MSGTLNRLNLRNEAFPFDHIRSNPSMIKDCIEDDFSKFLDKKNVYLTEEGKTIHNTYGIDVFPHKNFLEEDIYDAFSRRCKRFIDNISDETPTLYFIIFTPWDEVFNGVKSVLFDSRNYTKIKNSLIDLDKCINERKKDYKIVCIINILNEESKIEKIEETNNILFFKFKTTESSKGYTFKDHEEKIFEKFVNKIIQDY